jgi:hypothetical protein
MSSWKSIYRSVAGESLADAMRVATAAARAEHPEVWAGVYVNTEKVQA